MKTDLKTNCNREFPEWGREESIGGIQWKPQDICKGCDYLMACTAKKSSEILLGTTVPDEMFEFIGLFSKMSKEIL